MVYYDKKLTITAVTEPERPTRSTAGENPCLKTADLCDGWVDCPDQADEQKCGMITLLFCI